MKRILLLCAFLAHITKLHAYDEERALNNIAHEMAECSAYFMISSQAIMRSGDKELANMYLERAEVMMAGSAKFTNKERATARVQLSLK